MFSMGFTDHVSGTAFGLWIEGVLPRVFSHGPSVGITRLMTPAVPPTAKLPSRR